MHSLAITGAHKTHAFKAIFFLSHEYYFSKGLNYLVVIFHAKHCTVPDHKL